MFPRSSIQLVVFVLFCQIAIGQSKISEYAFYPKDLHASFHLKLIGDKCFEYRINAGSVGGNPFAFGEIEHRNKMHILKSKLKDFDLKIFSATTDSAGVNRLLINPLIYEDSTIENNAYLILDNDSTREIFINGYVGVSINSDFKMMRIKIGGRFYTRPIFKEEFKGNTANLVIASPFQFTELLYQVNDNYFTFESNNSISMFNKEGVFMNRFKKVF